MNLTFSEAMLATVCVGSPNLTDDQAARLQSFFGDTPADASTEPPRVKLLRWLVYRRAVKAGQVSASTPVDAVNWQGILAFLQGLLPIIEAIIALFGGGPNPKPPTP